MNLFLMLCATGCSLIVGYVTYAWVGWVLSGVWIVMIWPTYRDALVYAAIIFIWSGSALVLIVALFAGSRWAIGLDKENV